MSDEFVPRLVRADDFVAESLEHEASLLPPSQIDTANLLRGHAARLRASAGTKYVRVWEEKPKDV